MTLTAVWRRENKRCIIEVVPDLRKNNEGNYYWKGGIPIDPKIPKWLVKITDKFIKDVYYPTDEEFSFVSTTLDTESLGFVIEAFKQKEEHNKANLKNPESRKKEQIFSLMLKEYNEQKKIIQLKFR
jgi:hypothetical protein